MYSYELYMNYINRFLWYHFMIPFYDTMLYTFMIPLWFYDTFIIQFYDTAEPHTKIPQTKILWVKIPKTLH